MRKKTSFAQVVPWRNREEWLEVYQKLYSNELEELEWSINQVSIWQARCPTSSLLGVETTAGLVRARILDLNQGSSAGIFGSQCEVSMVYSMAIVRFVNLVCEIGKSRSHVTPIRSIARGMGIPEWLINLRHSATHRHNIPSLDVLRTGSSVALEWLRLNYWEREKDNLNDIILGTAIEGRVTEKIKNCLHEFQNVQYSVLYGQNRKVLKMNRSSLNGVLNGLRKLLKRHPYTFIQGLTETGYLIPKYEHLDALLRPGEKDFLNSNSIQLPVSLEKFWSPVFGLFSHNDHLQCLLKFLLEPNNKGDFTERLAAAWALHILNLVSSQETGMFNFTTSLNWMQLLEIALKKPTQYSPHVLMAISESVSMNEETKQALMALVAIFLGSVSGTVVPKKFSIYGLEDVKKILPLKDSKSVGSGPWGLYGGKNEWQKMPLGFVINSSKSIPPPDKLELTANNNEHEIQPIITEPEELSQEMIDEDFEDIDDEEHQLEQSLTKQADLCNSLLIM